MSHQQFTEGKPEFPPSGSRFRYLLLGATIQLFLMTVLGGIIRIYGGGGCPDWPTCYGKWWPPAEIGAVLDYSHRLLTALIIPVLLAAAVWGWRSYGKYNLI
ncbi:MAG: hypothetical protein OEY93_12250, partial [Anaerolineae bacterium]|nr:hypothetical protein [Anaerolineae bacterium]